jgi:23S rRNA (pseudouridine1915-N3)-methyltransferase
MKLSIIAVGNRMPDWVEAATGEYLKRMGRDLPLELVPIRPQARAGGVSTARAMAQEAERIRSAMPRQAHVVILDERGDDVTTRQLAQRLERWMQAGSDVAIVIGGPDGIDADLKGAAHESLRLSSLTLPHALARVVLAEQLYRALSLLKNHPYHRE